MAACHLIRVPFHCKASIDLPFSAWNQNNDFMMLDSVDCRDVCNIVFLHSATVSSKIPIFHCRFVELSLPDVFTFLFMQSGDKGWKYD